MASRLCLIKTVLNLLPLILNVDFSHAKGCYSNSNFHLEKVSKGQNLWIKKNMHSVLESGGKRKEKGWPRYGILNWQEQSFKWFWRPGDWIKIGWHFLLLIFWKDIESYGIEALKTYIYIYFKNNKINMWMAKDFF